MAEEVGAAAEEGAHVKAVTGNKAPAKYVDYPAFGKTLDNFMHDKCLQESDVAKRVQFDGIRAHEYEAHITKARRGQTTSVGIVKSIAEELGLEVPYLDKALMVEKISPFGRGRPKGSGRGRGGDKNPEE